MEVDPQRLVQKFAAVWPLLDERGRRLMAGSEALTLAYGGVSVVQRASGLSRQAIARGMREIQQGAVLEPGRVRRAGAGRKPVTVRDPELLAALDRLIEPVTLGDPESPLRWVCKSTRMLAAELDRQGHPIGSVPHLFRVCYFSRPSQPRNRQRSGRRCRYRSRSECVTSRCRSLQATMRRIA